MERILKRALAAFAGYLAFSLAWFGHALIAHPATFYLGSSDGAAHIWFLAWWPHAIGLRINPLLTGAVWSPVGYNLAWATSIPLLAVAVWPITGRFGPVVAYNVLTILAPAVSATAAFVLCTAISASFLGCLAGGYVFGFSPFITGHLLWGHLVLAFEPWIPLAVWLSLQRFRGHLSRAWFVPSLTLVALAQFLTSSEIFATGVLIGAITMLLAILVMRECRPQLLSLFTDCAVSMGITAIAASPFIYYLLTWPEVLAAGGHSFTNSGLPSLVLTPTHLLIGLAYRAPTTDPRFYLGPLLAIVVIMAGPLWRSSAGRVLVLSALAAFILSLGASRKVGGLIIRLPWWPFYHLPVIREAMPARIAVHVYLALAILTALFVADLRVRMVRIIVVALVGLSFLCRPAAIDQALARNDTPAFFSGASARRLIGAQVLIITREDRHETLWQAEDEMKFRMPNGWVGGIPPQYSNDDDLSVRNLRQYVKQRGVDIVVVESGNLLWPRAEVESALRISAEPIGGVDIYDLAPVSHGG